MHMVFRKRDWTEPVPGMLRRREDRASIENRSDCAFRRRTIVGVSKEFERASPPFIPPGIKVDHEIEPAVPWLDRVVVRVDMGIQAGSVTTLVRPAAKVPGIINKILDTGQSRKNVEELNAADGVVQLLERPAQRPDVFEGGLSTGLAVNTQGVALIETRKLLRQQSRKVVVKKVINHQVGKRRGP